MLESTRHVFRASFGGFLSFLAIFGHFWPFLAIFGKVPAGELQISVEEGRFDARLARKWSNNGLDRVLGRVWRFWSFLAILATFGPFPAKIVSATRTGGKGT